MTRHSQIIPDKFDSYEAAVNWMYYELPKSSPKSLKGEVGLAKSRQILQQAGNPQDSARTIHIAATSGKGSTAYILSSMLISQGYKVGTITSPHVYDLRERFMIDLEYVDKQYIASVINNQLVPLVKTLHNQNIAPSFFEFTTLLGFKIFKNVGVDIMVVETGLGGRLDSTNTISRSDKLSVIGRLGLDHTEILGSTINEIAYEKSGIMKVSEHAIALSQSSKINGLIIDRAKSLSCNLEMVRPGHYPTEIKDAASDNMQLSPEYQKDNLALAYAALTRVHQDIDVSVAVSKLRELSIPGRMEAHNLAGKLIVFDGAHNSQKIESLCRSVQKTADDWEVYFATGEAKDAAAMLTALESISSQIHLSSYDLGLSDMAKAANTWASSEFDDYPKIDQAHIASAIQATSSRHILVTGSLFFIGEVKKQLNI